MGCTSSQEEVQEISYGPCEPVAGQKKQFIEAVNLPNKGAQKKVETPKFETPKYVKSVAGRRRALLIGCNYPGSKYKLQGCIRDVRMIKNTLEFQYQYEDILLLVDDGSTAASPTGAVMKDALGSLLRAGEPGDSILMYYSGHGTQGVDPNSKDPYQAGIQDEAIVPTDFNLIYNEDLRALVNENLQPGVKFTLIADSCHSGNLLLQESPSSTNAPSKAIGRYLPPSAVLESLADQHGIVASAAPLATHLVKLFKNTASNHSKRNCSDHDLVVYEHIGAPGENLEVILLSGCRQGETSEELPGPNGAINGALTSAILDITSRANTDLSNQDVFVKASDIISARGVVQHPQLEVNRKQDVLSLFILPDNSQMESYVPTRAAADFT